MATAFHVEDTAVVITANVGRHVMMWLIIGWLVKKNFFSDFMRSRNRVMITQIPTHGAAFALTSF
jgi:hypothetical protein